MHENLSDPDLLKLLDAEEDQLPRAAVDEILRRRDTLAPALLAILNDRARWKQPVPACVAPVHAAFILAAMRPPDLLEPLLRAMRLAFELNEVFVMDHADILLAACGPEALDPLIAVARNRGEPLELRFSVNEAVARIGLAHASARTAARTHLLEAARGKDDFDLRNLAAHGFAEFATARDRDALKELEKSDLIGPDVVELVLEDHYPAHYGAPIHPLDLYDPKAIAERRKLLDEVEDEPLEPDLPDDPALETISRLDEPDGPPMPIVNAAAKVGRNDPCPCGSGSKFKKCCGR